MTPRTHSSITQNLIETLQDDDARAVFGALIDEKLNSYSETVRFLVKENDRLAAENKLNEELFIAKTKIRELEAYSRRENLIIPGFANAAEAVTKLR